MIPFVQQPQLSLGPLHLQAFGAILMGAILVGEAMYRHRLRTMHLDVTVGMGMAWYILVAGFVGAHLFSVLFYFPEDVREHPLLLFKIWEDVSSFGGMLGGAIGAALYLRQKGAAIPIADKWRYCDTVAFVAPFGWAIGRVACSLAHDHPGTVTKFPLAISLASPQARAYIARVYSSVGLALPAAGRLPTSGFNDLGWYEFLYLTFFVVPLFLWLDHRKPAWLRRSGGWVITLVLAYAPMRIALDTLRIADVRYLGFTPGQYAAGLLLLAVAVLILRRPRKTLASA